MGALILTTAAPTTRKFAHRLGSTNLRNPVVPASPWVVAVIPWAVQWPTVRTFASAFLAAAKPGTVAMTSRCSVWVVAAVAVRVAVTIGKARRVMVTPTQVSTGMEMATKVTMARSMGTKHPMTRARPSTTERKAQHPPRLPQAPRCPKHRRRKPCPAPLQPAQRVQLTRVPCVTLPATESPQPRPGPSPSDMRTAGSHINTLEAPAVALTAAKSTTKSPILGLPPSGARTSTRKRKTC
mmetsp:Transcript_17411/g.41282  ORF Transcript_17411/g.41282 Transcript_17411/m.41282 type:complete len:239 (+) Transcript_17411:414-1130(+)